MADIFVDSVSGSNTSPYDTKAKAATSIYSAPGVAVAGDIVKVSDLHVEAGAASTCAWPTGDATTYIIGWNFAGDTPTDTKATKSGTYGEHNVVNSTGNAHYRGLRYKAALGHQYQSTTNSSITYENCYLYSTKGSTDSWLMGHTSASARCEVNWINTDVEISNAGASLVFSYGHRFTWIGGDLVSTVVPTAFLKTYTFTPGSAKIYIQGVDFASGLAWTGNGLYESHANEGAIDITLDSCKIGAGGSWYKGALLTYQSRVRASNSKIGTVRQNINHRTIHGVTESVTDVYISSTTDGTTPFSIKASPESKCQYGQPLACPPIPFYIDSTSSQTATIEIGGDSGTLTDKQVSVLLLYPDADGVLQPVAYDGVSIGPKRGSITDTGNNIATSSATWTGSAIVTKQKLVTPAYTPGIKGVGYAYVYIHDSAITQLWIDPFVTVA